MKKNSFCTSLFSTLTYHSPLHTLLLATPSLVSSLLFYSFLSFPLHFLLSSLHSFLILFLPSYQILPSIINDGTLGSQGVIDVDEIMCSYDFTWHPDVKNGEINACSKDCLYLSRLCVCVL